MLHKSLEKLFDGNVKETKTCCVETTTFSDPAAEYIQQIGL